LRQKFEKPPEEEKKDEFEMEFQVIQSYIDVATQTEKE
jgi:hypothetical protein